MLSFDGKEVIGEASCINVDVSNLEKEKTLRQNKLKD